MWRCEALTKKGAFEMEDSMKSAPRELHFDCSGQGAAGEHVKRTLVAKADWMGI